VNVKDYYRYTIIYLIIGVILFTIGIIKYFFLVPYLTYNLRTLLPTISDGSLFLLLGLGFIVISFYRIKNKKKIINNELEWQKKNKKKEEKRERKYGIKP
jgi:tellurite resistance protein TehA-like permease